MNIVLRFGKVCLLCGEFNAIEVQRGMKEKQIIGQLTARGLIIKDNFICRRCENKLINSSCSDSDYLNNCHRLQKIWCAY